EHSQQPQEPTTHIYLQQTANAGLRCSYNSDTNMSFLIKSMARCSTRPAGMRFARSARCITDSTLVRMLPLNLGRVAQVICRRRSSTSCATPRQTSYDVTPRESIRTLPISAYKTAESFWVETSS